MKKFDNLSSEKKVDEFLIENKRNLKGFKRIFKSKELGILIVLIIIFLAVISVQPSYFSISSLSNVGQRAAVYGIISFGMVFLLSMGEIDLSVGSIYALTLNSTGALIVAGLNPWIAAFIGLLIGSGLGAVNGLLANIFRIPVIIITLGTVSMYRGLTLIVTGGTTLWGLPREHAFFGKLGGRFFGIPFILIIFIVLAIILTIIYRKSRFGFIVRAIGSNSNAARLAGINIPRIRIITLSLVGLLCSISGIMTLAFFAAGDPTIGSGYELLAIAAAIIGGTALSGGSGTIPGALIGSFVIAIISSAIIQFGVSATWSNFVTGGLIVFSVGIDALIRRRQKI